MAEDKKPVVFQGTGYRIVRSDPRNLMLEVEAEIEGKKAYRFKGYFQTIEHALANVVFNDLLIDENNPHNAESYLKSIESTRKTIIADIKDYYQNVASDPVEDSLNDDDLF